MKITPVDINSLKPYPKNAKKHPKEQIEKIKRSIQEFGFNQPIVVDKDNVVIVGHGRLEAAKELGLEEVPVLTVELKEEQANAYRLADNKLNESEWDMELVMEELKGLSDEMVELTGFELDLTPDEIVEDEVLEPPAEPKAKLGDIYQLGEHRLMCGDATKKEDVEKLMDGEKADMVFTDPPYGIKIVGNNGKVGAEKLAKNQVYSEVIGDDTTDTAKDFYITCKDLGFNKFIIWGGNYFTDFLPFSPSWIVWDKRGEMNSNNFADGEMAWCSFHTRVRIYKQIWNGMIREGESDKRVHPTQKPIHTLGAILEDFTETGEKVVDLFGGSGSTLIACEQTNRRCYMMELDPKYIDVIIERWKKFTGEKAVKI